MGTQLFGAPVAVISSLADLRERHLDLLERWTDEAPSAEEAESLRLGAQALGAWLDEPEDRDRAQGIIDYWAATLAALPGHTFPAMLRLAPYDVARVRALSDVAEALCAQFDDIERGSMERVLLRLVRPGRKGVVVLSVPVTRSQLLDGADDTAPAARALNRLVRAGIVRRVERPGEEDRFDLMHASLARECPRLKALLADRFESDQMRDRLIGLAQQWAASMPDPGDSPAGRKAAHTRNAGYLLTGDVLDKARLYIGQDDTLDAFIAASNTRSESKRRDLLIALAIGPALLGLTLVEVFDWGKDIGKDRGAVKAEGAAISERELERELSNEQRAVAAKLTPVATVNPSPKLGRIGYVWAGNADDRLLRDYPSRHLADPTKMDTEQMAGRTFVTRVDITFRERPIDDQRAGREIGIVPAGTLVVATGRPETQSRPAGRQYWLPVRVVPRLFIQYTNGDRERVRTLEEQARKVGFDVQGEGGDRKDAEARGFRQIRYVHDADKPSAAALYRALAPSVGALDCQTIGGTLRDHSTIELWIDFAAPARAPTGKC